MQNVHLQNCTGTDRENKLKSDCFSLDIIPRISQDIVKNSFVTS